MIKLKNINKAYKIGIFGNKKIVAADNINFTIKDVVSKDSLEVVTKLKRGSGRAIWLCGGSNFATTLLAADLIDELVVKLNPVVFGVGIPLFGSGVHVKPLKCSESKVYDSGHAVLHYTLTG